MWSPCSSSSTVVLQSPSSLLHSWYSTTQVELLLCTVPQHHSLSLLPALAGNSPLEGALQLTACAYMYSCTYCCFYAVLTVQCRTLSSFFALWLCPPPPTTNSHRGRINPPAVRKYRYELVVRRTPRHQGGDR